ncbi:MAG TPA: DUF3352 domain-containing protein, partial [Candidatus Limnocylindrales bacterium]|nr:DUF3352 domain-containing protein [Candidatus Limnocylindrales bacterium]
MTRRLTALLLAALLLVVAGCGGGKSSSGTSLDDQLGYLPKDAPLVGVIETNPESGQLRNLDKLASKFLLAGQVKAELKKSIAQGGVDFDKDVKPLLGGQLVIGSPDVRSLTDSEPRDAYVVAWGVKDGDKLRDLIKKQGKSKESGKVAGQTAFEASDGSVVVVKGDLLVGASDRPTLQAAFDRHDGGDKLTQSQFDDAFGDLPKLALARVYGNLQKLLEADPAAATARQVKWVAGLRTFAVTVTAENDGPAVDASINTDGLSANDLPLAPGDEAPRVARIGEFGVGLRNAQQLSAFVQSTLRAVDPSQFASFARGKKVIGRAAGIDIDGDLIGQLTGATSIS